LAWDGQQPPRHHAELQSSGQTPDHAIAIVAILGIAIITSSRPAAAKASLFYILLPKTETTGYDA